MITYSQFDSEEPLHFLTDIIQEQKLEGKLLIGLKFKADVYDKGVNFDFHVNQDTEGRVAMDAQTFQTTIQAWLQRPEVVLIEDLIKN